MIVSLANFPADELRAMGQRLIELADAADASGQARRAGSQAPGELQPKQLLALTRMIYKARRGRTDYFGPDLFADPAWDILLDLFVSELSNKRVSTTRLCTAASVPMTTALRYIGHLESVGLVGRGTCETDGRVQWRTLTPKGFRLMREYVERYWGHLASADTEFMLVEP